MGGFAEPLDDGKDCRPFFEALDRPERLEQPALLVAGGRNRLANGREERSRRDSERLGENGKAFLWWRVPGKGPARAAACRSWG
jgi:hypothetical protein